MPNYANGKIYKIWSLSTDEIYIGSTVEPLSKRMTKHRCDYKKYKEGKKNYITSFKILEYGDAKIELIEKCSCSCREELVAREGHYVRTLNCVNYNIPDGTIEEWREANKDKMAEYHKQYYEINKDKITEYHKQYSKINKEKIALANKKYYKKNKEAIIRKNKQYRQANKETIYQRIEQYYQANKEAIVDWKAKKVPCGCGAIVSNSNMARHRKSKKHLLFMNTRN